MILLKPEESKSHLNKKTTVYMKKNLELIMAYQRRVRDHCHYTDKCRCVAHSICNLKYKTPRNIVVGFHKLSDYGYKFIINDLAKEFKGKFDNLKEKIIKA